MEYKREIVESKLQELDGKDSVIAELRSAYRKVRNSFTPRVARSLNVVERSRPAPQAASMAVEIEIDDDRDFS